MALVCKESCLKSYFEQINEMCLSLSEKEWDYKQCFKEFSLRYMAVKTNF